MAKWCVLWMGIRMVMSEGSQDPTPPPIIRIYNLIVICIIVNNYVNIKKL